MDTAVPHLLLVLAVVVAVSASEYHLEPQMPLEVPRALLGEVEALP